MKEIYEIADDNSWKVCEAIAEYSTIASRKYQQLSLFAEEKVTTHDEDIRVIELFAGVGGFRIGLERASERFKTVWNNQWEPSTKRQDASIIYCKRFGNAGHSNEDISTVPVEEIDDVHCLLLCIACQKRSKGLQSR